ncbi:hypothetical protein [Mycolicibacterium sp. 050158]|uniref:hypothetical protein n=1 Tax=Mycolicibacterium sp. 050158 TaxID=3090602 RepID=UPI00299EAB8D|nr:hypothetical protein [Mycolicibacterium sp. 050158]MDX1888147.1 hypothetical protein [Mycolicibacterium sp. 050158]
MIKVKSFLGGSAVAASLALAPLALGAGMANAAPSPAEPQVPTVQGAGQTSAQTPSSPAPSPYADYGSRAVCAMPGLYFVNICV